MDGVGDQESNEASLLETLEKKSPAPGLPEFWVLGFWARLTCAGCRRARPRCRLEATVFIVAAVDRRIRSC